MLYRLIEDRILRVDETNFDPSRCNEKGYVSFHGPPRIRTDSIASFINRILSWWWDERKSIRDKKIERQLRNLTTEIGSLKTEYRKLQRVLCVKEKTSERLTIEYAEDEEILV